VYVVSLSCELPYAVGVRKNMAQLYYTPLEKAKEKADYIIFPLRIAAALRLWDLGRS
jgi:hypothetical protein